MVGKFKPILSVNELSSLLGYKVDYIKELAKNFKDYYYEDFREIKGKTRKLECTKGNYKKIQRKINNLLSEYPFPEYVLGGIKGKSIKENAKIHIGCKTLVTIDIKDCFPNTSDARVYNTFMRLGFSSRVSGLLTRFATYNHHVPQGASCSSVVVSLCLLPLCSDVVKICRDNKLNFSIWVDDIAISGEGADKVISSVVKVIENHGYSCRCKKIKYWKGKNINKEITGISLKNDMLTVSKKRIEECRRTIISMAKNNHGKGLQREMQSLKGKIVFIESLDRVKAKKLKLFAKRVGLRI